MKALNLLLVSALLMGCAEEIKHYSESEIALGSTTDPAIVVSRRIVSVDFKKIGSVGEAASGGAVIGGAYGAISRDSVGGGIGGALGGAAAAALGHSLHKALRRRSNKDNAFQYIVRKEDGSLVTVIQNRKNEISVKTKVFLTTPKIGPARLTAMNEEEASMFVFDKKASAKKLASSSSANQQQTPVIVPIILPMR